jgi:ABC-type branched-subunit amino acid transport system substrate-binding protein
MIMVDKHDLVNRRRVLQVVGGSTVAALAGCTGGDGDGNGTQDGGTPTMTSVEPVEIGAVMPLSGPFSSVAKEVQKSIDLAVEHANAENDAGQREVSVTYKDTQLDSSKARQKAGELIDDGVAFLTGNISSGTLVSVGDLAAREEMPFIGIGSLQQSTGGEKCNDYMFNVHASDIMQANAVVPYLFQEDISEKFYRIGTDVANDYNVEAEQKRIIEENGGGLIESFFGPITKTDFSSQLQAARDSEADTLIASYFGRGLTKLLNQAQEFGIYDEMTVSPTVITLDTAKQLPQQINAQYYSTLQWYWQLPRDVPTVETYIQSFRDKHGAVPSGYGGLYYGSTRTALHTIASNGGTDPTELANSLEGREWDVPMWGVGEHFRTCDHRLVRPLPIVTGTGPSEFDKETENYLDVIDSFTDAEAELMVTCQEAAEAGCEMAGGS